MCHFDQMQFRSSVVSVKCRSGQVSFRSSVVRSSVVRSTVVVSLFTYCNICDLIVLILIFLYRITLSCCILLVPQLSKSINLSNHCCHYYHLESVVKPTIIIVIIIFVKAKWKFLTGLKTAQT